MLEETGHFLGQILTAESDASAVSQELVQLLAGLFFVGQFCVGLGGSMKSQLGEHVLDSFRFDLLAFTPLLHCSDDG